MKKTQNYKVVDLIESYNFCVKIISIRVCMKKIWFFKIRPCHASGVARQGCTVTLVGVAWQAWHVEYVLADSFRALQSLPTWHTLSCQCMWRNSIFLSRHADWRDQTGHICKYLFGWVIFKIKLKNRLKMKNSRWSYMFSREEIKLASTCRGAECRGKQRALFGQCRRQILMAPRAIHSTVTLICTFFSHALWLCFLSRRQVINGYPLLLLKSIPIVFG